MCRFCELAKNQIEDDFGLSDPSFKIPSKPMTTAAKFEAENCIELKKKRTPVFVICGFLGSGKTTLLNHILRSQHELCLAVLENEIGEVSVDDEILEQYGGIETIAIPEVILMPNGCLCCRSRGDLRDALKRIMERQLIEMRKLDGIIIELSGASEVAPVLQTFFLDDFMQSTLRMDSVICVCDAFQLHQLFFVSNATQKNDSDSMLRRVTSEQLVFADKILINKTDLVDAAYLSDIQNTISSLNSVATIFECTHGMTDINNLLGKGNFSFSEVIDRNDNFLLGTKKHSHAHNKLGIRNIGIEESINSINSYGICQWLRTIIDEHGIHIWRVKGVLWSINTSGKHRRTVVQGVGGRLEIEEVDWPIERVRRSRLVLIGPFSEELEADLRETLNKLFLPVVVCRIPEIHNNAKNSNIEAEDVKLMSKFGSAKASARTGGKFDYEMNNLF